MIAVVGAIVVGALAAVVRFVVARGIRAPWGVLVVNVAGSAIGGAVVGLATRFALGDDVRLVLLGGLCGGLTTFSTLSVETIQLAQEGKWREAIGGMAANLVLGVGAAAAAWTLVALPAG
jgi:CrcB protein